MPELPEVETMVRDLSQRVTGRTIVSLETLFSGSVAWPSLLEFEARLTGQRIDAVWRRAKFAVFDLRSRDVLIVHRGMTGSVLLRAREDPPASHLRLVFQLDDGSQLRYHDQRKFGRVYLMSRDGQERPLPWAHLGPEPLNGSFTLDDLSRRLSGRTAVLKPLLLNQRIVAGLGNIYVDEALHQAGIHPARRAGTLLPVEIARLHAAIRDVLRKAIEKRGTTFDSYVDVDGRAGGNQDSLQVFQQTGKPCRRCGREIVRLVIGGRGTHICPNCQRDDA